MKKFILVFFISLSIFSCSSSKTSLKKCNDYRFEQLDSLARANQVLNYKINIPKNWKKSKTSDGDWYFLEDEFIDSLGYYTRKADIYISLNKIKNECNNQEYSSKDFLNYFIDYRSLWFNNKSFKYQLSKSDHKRYGEFYTLKYVEKVTDKKSYVRSFFLFFHQNKGYAIQYVAEPKYYDLYLPEVEKMINSFEINED
ncbi:MAG: hypothetical protein ACKVIG_09960 [Flavobacteriales bacterium]